MSLRLVSHSKILSNIINRKQKFNELSASDMESVIKLASTDIDRQHFFESVLNENTTLLDNDSRKPYWLDNNFEAPDWILNLSESPKHIHWGEVVLSDGNKLTDEIHRPLLNTFKTWILATDDPLVNGGKFSKKITVKMKVTLVVSLINAILINGDKIGLAKNHLFSINRDFIMSIINSLASAGSSEGIYRYSSRVKDFIATHCNTITKKEIDIFKKKYPVVMRDIQPEEMLLGLSIEERLRVCCFLKSNGHYSSNLNMNRKLSLLIYSGKIINPSDVSFNALSELQLIVKNPTEFFAVPVSADTEEFSDRYISRVLSAFRLILSSNSNNDTANISDDAFRDINARTVSLNTKVYSAGRYLSLPASLVFSSIKNAFEFCFGYMDDILDSVYNVLDNAPKENKSLSSVDRINGSSVFERWRNVEILKYISPALIDLGVECYTLRGSKVGLNFEDLRANKGLIELHSVLMGAIQVLIGAIMARRISELISLKPVGNLSHSASIVSNSKKFVDPNSIEGQSLEYKLIFILKKSGSGGEHGENKVIERPIPRAIAGFIFKLERFNQKIADSEIQKEKMSLFNYVNPQRFKLSKCNVYSYNLASDLFCDYFETDCIEYKGSNRRYYIRTHQLRRFFAMVFFWSKGFDGIDVLRHMLGHTDFAHLYHYITESLSGEVLNGVKATYLAEKVLNDDLEDIDKLRKTIANQFGVNKANILFDTISNVVEDYSDGYDTSPHISKLKKQQELESKIITLLEIKAITFEPEFFTISTRDGETQDFNLVLRVKELVEG